VATIISMAATTATAAAAEPSSESATCSWTARSEPATVNIAYPDLSATYWGHFFQPVPGERLVITGQYPQARYFSFHVYDASLVTIDSAYDAQIAPDPGSANPYVGKPRRGSGDSYTEYVDFSDPPSDPAPNTIYIYDTPQGAPTPIATLMYRVYVPDDSAEPAGSVPLPKLTLETESGTPITSYGACGTQLVELGGQLNEELADTNYPEGAPTPEIPGATDPLTWSRAYSNKYYGLYGNSQNAYLTATISRQYGQLVVIHGKAPTFPDTSDGQPVYAKRQVRYWSICENSDTTRVIGCAADYRAAISHGYYTYVISDPDRRPANATAANGVTWLPWGGTFPNGVVIYRNMLPAATFTQAVQSIAEGESPQTVMGPYFPQSAYCSTAAFEARGWEGCSAG
jgi:hypothetical protein